MRRKGFTLVEALLALALLVVILGLALRYFTDSAWLSREVQTRGELQDRVRMVMQVVTGDLQMAGAFYWNQAGQNVGFSLPPGLVLQGMDGGPKDSFTVYYVTSLRGLGEACRRVDYAFGGDTLRRSDVNATPAGGKDCTTPPPFFTPLADGIAALDILYVCSDGQVRGTPGCGPGAYPRSAVVEVVGYSLGPMRAQGPQTLTTASGQTVPCPLGRGCYALRQEVLLPNLKPLPQ